MDCHGGYVFQFPLLGVQHIIAVFIPTSDRNNLEPVYLESGRLPFLTLLPCPINRYHAFEGRSWLQPFLQQFIKNGKILPRARLKMA